MQYSDLMHRLGVELGLADFAPDEQGACAIQRDGLKVSFYADPGDAFTVICPLGHIDLDDLESQQGLLRGNLFAHGIGGSAIGIDGEGGAYLTQPFRSGELSFQSFLATLERFVALAGRWRTILANSQAQVADATY
jgi:hypothetical protein